MKETALPDDFPPDTSRSYFRGNPEFCLVYTVEDFMVAAKWVRKTPEINQFFGLISEKIESTGKKLQGKPTDLEIILVALDFVNFIDNNAEQIKKHFTIATTVIEILMICLYKLSDKIKNRNIDIILDAGWQFFDLLAKLENTNGRNVPPYAVFQMLMHPKIIDELRIQMRSVLEQMHDTEAEALRIPAAKKHPVFRADPPLCSKIADLQNEIEKSIAAGDHKNARELSRQLNDIIKDKNLKSDFEDTHFFCVTLNNFYSLHKLREIIKAALELGELTSLDKKSAFLQCLIKLGEYMSHRKLSNKFREGFPYIPWEAYQIIRDCLCHPENGDNVEITKRLLAGFLEKNGVSLKALQAELIELDNALVGVMKIRFGNPNNLFYTDYREKYFIQPVTVCSDPEKQTFLENLKSDDASVREEWRKVLSGEQLFPCDNKDNRRGAELKKAVFVAPDLNAPIRKRLEEIVGKLSDKTPAEDIEFLKTHLDTSVCPAEISLILPKLGVSNLIAKEKAVLRKSFPKPFYGQDTQKHELGLELVRRVEDIRDKGSRLLYPRQNKVFESTALFSASAASKARWTVLIKDDAVCSTVDEYCQVCELIGPDDDAGEDQAENAPEFDFSLNLNDIYEKIINRLEGRLVPRWRNRLCYVDLCQLLEILDKNPSIKKRWFKVLNRESDYPSQTEFREDLKVINAQSHDDARQFILLTKLLQPVVIATPSVIALKNMFQAGYKEKNEQKVLEPISYAQQKQICEIGIHEIAAMSSIIIDELYGEDFYKGKIIDGILNPLFDEAVYVNAEANPSFKAFLKERQKEMDLINEKMRANPGKKFRLPLERFAAMYKKMVVPSDIDQEIERAVLAETKVGIKQAFRDNHEFELPRRINHKAVFRMAVEFHLGRCLSLLKIIIKFANLKDAEFLIENYSVLKRYRNDLVHDDYLAESLGRDLKETTGSLAKLVDIIKGSLKAVLKSIDSVEEGEVSLEAVLSTAPCEEAENVSKVHKDREEELVGVVEIGASEMSSEEALSRLDVLPERIKLPEKKKVSESGKTRRMDFLPPPLPELSLEEAILKELKEVTEINDWAIYKAKEFYFLCEKKGISLGVIKASLEKRGVKSKINKNRLEVNFNQAQVLLKHPNKKPLMEQSKMLKK